MSISSYQEYPAHLVERLRLFRFHQLALMLVAWIIYSLGVSLFVILDLEVAGLFGAPHPQYNEPSLPIAGVIGLSIVAVGLVSTVFSVPAWVLSYCREQRDWFAFFVWMLVAPPFVGFAAIVIASIVLSITGGQIVSNMYG